MLSRPFITEKGYAKSKTEQQNVITDFSSYEQTEREHLVELHRQPEAGCKVESEKAKEVEQNTYTRRTNLGGEHIDN